MATVGQLLVELDATDKSYSVTVRRAGQVMREFTRELSTGNNAIRKHEEHHVSLARRFRNVMITIAAARFALMDFNQVILSLPRSVIKSSAEIERLTQLMRGLSKETDEAKRNAEAISNTNFVLNLAQKAPFEVKALADAFVKLKTAGLDPTQGAMQGLVDSVAKFGGTNEHLHRASIAIQQMGGKGVISMEELRQQLGEAVPNAAQLMADGLGLTMGELVKHISKGEVEARSALERMFFQMQVQNGGAAEAMMQTWAGMFNLLQTKWTLFQKEIGDTEFFAEMKNQLRTLIEGISGTDMKRLAQEIGSGMKTVVDGIVNLIQFVREYWGEIKVLAGSLALVWTTTTFISFVKSTVTGIATMITAAKGYSTAFRAEQARVDADYAKSGALRSALMRKATSEKQLAMFLENQADRKRWADGTMMSNGMIALHRAEAAARMQAAAAATAQAAAVSRAAGVMRVAGTAMNLLMGPIGWIITLLSLGALAWEKWGESAEEAIKKARDAAERGMSTVKDLQTVEEQIKKLEEDKIKAATGGAGVYNPEAVPEIERQLKELYDTRRRITESLENEESSRAQNARVREGQKDLQERERQAMQELAVFKKGLQDKNITGEAYTKAYVAEQKKIWAKHLGDHKAFLEKQIAQEEAVLTNSSADDAMKKRATANIAAWKDQLDQIETKLLPQVAKIGDVNLLKGKGEDKETPAERMLRRLKSRAAELNQELNKEGSGTIARLMSEMQENKGLSAAIAKDPAKEREITDAARMVSVLEEQVKTRNRLNQLTAGAESHIASVTASLDNESTASAKLDLEIQKLWEDTVNFTPAIFDQIVALEELSKRMKTVDQAAQDRRADSFQRQMIADTESMRSSIMEREEQLETQYQRDVARKLKEIEDMKVSDEKKKELIEGFNQWVVARTEVLNREMEGPLAKLLQSWQDVTNNMKNAQADWAKSAMDSLVEFVMTGKMKFSEFTESVLKDILRIKLQAQFSGLVNQGITMLGNAVMGSVFGAGSMTGNGTIGSTGTPYGAGAGFAKGGIMTSEGPLSLRKYAMGGIASSPQVALFGEGSRPEAYVPLPDGRSIPVTMKGGMGANVVVNVINQTGQQVQAEQSGPRFDGQQMVLDVVLSAVNRPGPFRDNMRGALK